jgi:hypothetical protein
MNKLCEYCKKEFERTWQGSKNAWDRQRFCSTKCRNKSREKGGSIWKDRDGYLIKDWYEGGNRKRARINRIVMEEHLGRKLERNEIVHHKDGNKENNNIDNLELFSSHKDHKENCHRVVSMETKEKLSKMRKGVKKNPEHAKRLREHLNRVRPSREKLEVILKLAREKRRGIERDRFGRFIKLQEGL